MINRVESLWQINNLILCVRSKLWVMVCRMVILENQVVSLWKARKSRYWTIVTYFRWVIFLGNLYYSCYFQFTWKDSFFQRNVKYVFKGSNKVVKVILQNAKICFIMSRVVSMWAIWRTFQPQDWKTRKTNPEKICYIFPKKFFYISRWLLIKS